MISRDIHDFLVKRGITAVRLADLVDITAVQLSRIMNGHSMPSRITMEKIAKVLDADISFSSNSGQWSLISKILGVSIRTMYGNRCDTVHSVSCPSDFDDILSIPLVDVSNITYATLSDQTEMGNFFAEASDFMPVPLKDLGTIGSTKPYAVKIESDSMSDAGIPYGSYIAVNPDELVYDGDPALIKWGKQNDTTVRWVFNYSAKIKLCSANPTKYPPIVLKKTEPNVEGNDINDDDTFHICGKVMAVYAKPQRGI